MAACQCVAAPCNCDEWINGVSDVGILGWKVSGGPIASGNVIGGVEANSASGQDVPLNGNPSVDGTSTTTDQSSPGILSLMWNTITRQGPGLFQCRPDSWFCAGTGSQAYKQNPNLGSQQQGSSFQTSLIMIVAALFILLLLARRLSP